MNQITLNNKKPTSVIFVDYRDKISKHIQNQDIIKAEDVNLFIQFFNWCFQERNDFLIENFNKSNLKHMLKAYNKIKSNILSLDYSVKIFDNLDVKELKLLKFIIFNIQSKFNEMEIERKSGIKMDYNSIKSLSLYIKTEYL